MLVNKELTSSENMNVDCNVIDFNQLTKSNISFSILSFLVNGSSSLEGNFAVE